MSDKYQQNDEPMKGNGNYCEYFNHCDNPFSQPCHETAWCHYGPAFPQGFVRYIFRNVLK